MTVMLLLNANLDLGGSDATGVTTPARVMAGQVYHRGVQRGEVYQGGTQKGTVYNPGVQRGKVVR